MLHISCKLDVGIDALHGSCRLESVTVSAHHMRRNKFFKGTRDQMRMGLKKKYRIKLRKLNYLNRNLQFFLGQRRRPS